MSAAALEAAMDGDEPEGALISYVVQAQAGGAPGAPAAAAAGAEPEPQPEFDLEPLALWERTFSKCNFKPVYERTLVPSGPLVLGAALKDMLVVFCKVMDIPWVPTGQRYFEELQDEAMQNASELANKDLIPDAAQRMWTSAKTLADHEFCSVVNYASRADTPAFVEPLAIFSRAINQQCVTRRGAGPGIHPDGDVCFRGGGFDDAHRSFFVAGKKFRQPAYLATSFDVEVANYFIRRSGMPSKVRWTIRIDPDRKCLHVNLITKTVPGLPDEKEYLFAPCTSAFCLRAGLEMPPAGLFFDSCSCLPRRLCFHCPGGTVASWHDRRPALDRAAGGSGQQAGARGPAVGAVELI